MDLLTLLAPSLNRLLVVGKLDDGLYKLEQSTPISTSTSLPSTGFSSFVSESIVSSSISSVSLVSAI